MEEENSLAHYGVVGMKWGVRRDASKAYAKAGRKIEKIDKKIAKRDAKIAKQVKKYSRAQYGLQLPWRNARKAKEKLQRQQYKREKQLRKGAKWVNQMENTFANTSVKMSAAHVAKGKQYVNAILEIEKARVDRFY